MSAFNEVQFEKRLLALKDTQDSIQSLSAWCLHHRQNHKKIVNTWLRVLKKAKIEHRLTLFYLANDVIQYSKRKNYEFVESWGTALQRATTMVRDDTVKKKVLRIFKIWDERGVYDESFIADLCGLLSTNTKKPATDSSSDANDFQTSVLVTKIRGVKDLEDDTDLKFKKVRESPVLLMEPDALRSHFKDRRQGDDVVAEVEEGASTLQHYTAALETEIKERMELIEMLEQGQNFYENQKGEAKVVANAYRNFGTRVKNLKKRLDEIIPTLRDASPVPSPPNVEDAPSPSPDSDEDLPEVANTTASEVSNSYVESYSTPEMQPIRTILQEDPQTVDKCFSSFMGNTLPFDIQKNLFNESSGGMLLSPSPEPVSQDVGTSIPGLPGLSASEGKPIEVINSRTKAEEGFNITDFLKSLIPQRSNSSTIPGLSLDSSDPEPQTPPVLEKQLPYSENPELLSSSTNEYEYPPIASSPTPLQPPPMPPNLFPLDESSQYKYTRTQETEDAWNTKLPSKFPTWGDTTSSGWEVDTGEKVSEWMPVLPVNKIQLHELDTPESPPTYEKEGFSDPVEYDDSVVESSVLLSSASDVDHRTLVPLPLANNIMDDPLPPDEHLEDTDHRMLMHIPATNHIKKDIDHRPLMHRKKDVDHRNLISLTGSPLREPHAPLVPPPTPPNLAWPRGDQDYRSQVPPMLDQDITTNIQEIVGEEDMDYRRPEPRKRLNENLDNVESVDMEMSDDEILESVDDMDMLKREPPPVKIMDTDMNLVGKPIISFNISSQAKILTSSPLNEVKEDSSKPKSRIYGCQKIPTIGGRIQSSPRPRTPMFSPGITRLPPPPPPPPPRNFRPALLLTPPPAPPQLVPQKEINSSVRIKPMAELIKPVDNVSEVTEAVTEREELPDNKEGIISEPEITSPIEEKSNSEVVKEDWNSVPSTELGPDEVTEVNSSVEPLLENKWTCPPPNLIKNPVSCANGPETSSTVVESDISMEQTNTSLEWTAANNGNNPIEPWMNDDIPEFESHVERVNSFDRGRGRGPKPIFKNFSHPPPPTQRGGFTPRGRAGWSGPRRGVGAPPPPPPPPPRFPFRPPHEPFGRGHRGFRPFRGNTPRHFGGW
ncbi:uncharacterized protein [Anabrus simplex]|uniref:uncharacterized protein n=1 Tax=Anabrus simplex TaxID=316456 RepID=UPI0035A36AFF